ncbi:hypothetical protein CR513_39028, partial [Mucuna pruriens]
MHYSFFLFWSYSLQIVAYLINHMPTIVINMTSPFETLFHCAPHYISFLIPTHSMTTQSKNRIYKPKQVHSTSKFPISKLVEPLYLTQALKAFE